MNCFLKVGMLEQCFINDEFTINFLLMLQNCNSNVRTYKHIWARKLQERIKRPHPSQSSWEFVLCKSFNRNHFWRLLKSDIAMRAMRARL